MILPPWLLTTKVKLAIAGAVLVGFWWWHEHEMAKAYSRAAEETTDKLLKQQSKEIDRQVAEKTAQLDAERTELEGQRTALTAERAALSGQRRELFSGLDAKISLLTDKQRETLNETIAIPASAVRPAIRTTLAELRAGSEPADRN